MSTVLDDYKVDYLREESIAETALTWRREARNEFIAYFNIVEFVIGVLTKRTKRTFKIEFFDAREGEKPAFVRFNPRTLHIDKEVWRLAELGEPDAHFIIAHEVGHLILHDHHAKAFSNNPGDRIKFAETEYSAEWQANTFASYLLVPYRMLRAFDSFSDLSKACAINDAITQSRYELLTGKGRTVIRDGSICPKCGNLTVMSNGRCASSVCQQA